jgi:type VI secretion system protein ImpG
MEKLLPYFERELSMLRRAGGEFAGRYPKLAGSLQMRGEACADPHVERLIQASAFLNARVAKLLDDGYSNFTEALLGMLYPHYLRPIPSCSIARIDYSAAKANEITNVAVLPRGAAMKSLGRSAVACRFRTVYDTTIAPIAISAAWFEPYIQVPSTLPLPPEVGAAIAITIESTSASRSLAALCLSTLRIFIDGEASLRATLRDTMFMQTACACVEANGQWRMLSKVPIAPVGFAADEALLPAAPSEHSAYRLLSEFFAFPEKFDFVDIDLAAVLAVCPESCTRITLRLALADVRPDSQVTRILRTLSVDNLILGCTPIINLFAQPATPIRITHARSSYPLMADDMPATGYEIYSIDSVQLLRKSPQGSSITEFFPYYSLRHGDAASRKGHYWLARRDDQAESSGHEFSLALLDREFSPLRLEEGTASVRVTCTNRDLPQGLPYGRAGGDLSTESAAGSFPIRMLRRPTASHHLTSEGSRHWGLIAHLALNHRSLTQEGLPSLLAMLQLYTRLDDPVAQRQIDGIVELSYRSATAWVRQGDGNAYLRGVEIRIALDEEAYTGSGLHIFVQVLDHLFSLHVHLNSFTQLLVTSHASGKELLRCPPRNGLLTLA